MTARAGEHAGRRILVTGAASGIGEAVARLLVSEGATVGLLDRDGGRLAGVAASLGEGAVALCGDVSDEAAVEAMTRRFAEGSGGLDALVTAAGIQRYGTVSETTLTLWNEVLAVNLTGVFLAVRAALPWLRQADGGAITIVSSVQAFVSQGGVAAYVASKGALNAFARAVAIDEAGEGVRVNVVCPGSVDTPMLAASAELFADAHHSASELLARWGASHPLGRLATPSEVAEVAAFLLSRRAAFVTGEEIRVDGGLLAAIPVVLPERTGTER